MVRRTILSGDAPVKPRRLPVENALLGFSLMHSIHAKASQAHKLAGNAGKSSPVNGRHIGGNCMVSRKVSRRRFVAGTAALSTVAVAAPFVRGAYAAGKLSVGFWDHWVPNANGATEKLIKEWAEKEKVDIQIDFITSQGNKLLLTTAAESQAKAGHDILAMNTFLPARYSEKLVPVNAEMDQLIKNNGKVNATVEYL